MEVDNFPDSPAEMFTLDKKRQDELLGIILTKT